MKAKTQLGRSRDNRVFRYSICCVCGRYEKGPKKKHRQSGPPAETFMVLSFNSACFPPGFLPFHILLVARPGTPSLFLALDVFFLFFLLLSLFLSFLLLVSFSFLKVHLPPSRSPSTADFFWFLFLPLFSCVFSRGVWNWENG